MKRRRDATAAAVANNSNNSTIRNGGITSIYSITAECGCQHCGEVAA
jgi:hypothetical protein